MKTILNLLMVMTAFSGLSAFATEFPADKGYCGKTENEAQDAHDISIDCSDEKNKALPGCVRKIGKDAGADKTL